MSHAQRYIQTLINDALRGNRIARLPGGSHDIEGLHIGDLHEGRHEGLTITADRGATCTLRQIPPLSGKLAGARLLTTLDEHSQRDCLGELHYPHRSPDASGELRISGITLDGNRKALGYTGGLAWEQQALVFLTSHAQSLGKLTADVSDLRLMDGGGAGVKCYHHVALSARLLHATDFNRGGVTATGLACNVTVTDSDFERADVDIEPNHASPHHITLARLNITDAELDVKLSDSRSTLTATNIDGPRLRLYNGGGRANLQTCYFTSADISLPGVSTLADCMIARGVVVEWRDVAGQRLTFERCSFSDPHPQLLCRVHSGATAKELDSWLVLTECSLEGTGGAGIVGRGGNFALFRNAVECSPFVQQQWDERRFHRIIHGANSLAGAFRVLVNKRDDKRNETIQVGAAA